MVFAVGVHGRRDTRHIALQAARQAAAMRPKPNEVIRTSLSTSINSPIPFPFFSYVFSSNLIKLFEFNSLLTGFRLHESGSFYS